MYLYKMYIIETVVFSDFGDDDNGNNTGKYRLVTYGKYTKDIHFSIFKIQLIFLSKFFV